MVRRRSLLIGLAVIAGLTLWQLLASPSPQQESIAPIGDVPASQAKQYTLDVGDSAILEFAELNGNITIFTAPTKQVSVVVTKRAFGVDKESAQRDLESFSAEPQMKDRAISFELPGGAKSGRQADYKITAPPDTSVKVAKGSGNITIGGIRGDIDINGQNLTLAFRDIRGAITIRSEAGSVQIVDAIGKTTIQSGKAAVQLDRVTGASMSVVTGANTVVKDSGAEMDATFRIQNGDLTLTRFRAQTLTVLAPDGQIRINESSAKQAILETQQGLINLFRVAADTLEATTSSGTVALDQVQGSFNIKTQKGAVNLTEVAAVGVSIAGGTGNVVFYGALPTEGQHTIKTSSGNISVFIVKESALRLDASTKGKITIDPPFEFEDANKSDGRWRGVINQGTMLLVLTSASGDILISSEQPY
ncbi:MAG: DUF4097 family beta strand repeat protein [Chloroflexi bacterium]|nr:DUF4097 family beta strand repeat protein [Chloroflexota bacterium]